MNPGFFVVMQTCDFVSDFHNASNSPTPLLFIYQAMQTRKTFFIAYIFSPIPQVNNAGIVAKGTIETTSLESFDKVMRINTR